MNKGQKRNLKVRLKQIKNVTDRPKRYRNSSLNTKKKPNNNRKLKKIDFKHILGLTSKSKKGGDQ